MDHYEIVCDRLFALKSWSYEQKSRLLDIIINWTSQLEKSEPAQLEARLLHLRELLAHNILIVPKLPIETILEVIQSVDIPCEAWLDCLLAAVLSNSEQNSPHPISFNFSSVSIPEAAINTQEASSVLYNSISPQTQHILYNQYNRYFYCSYVLT